MNGSHSITRRFDYSVLTPALATEARAAAERIRSRLIGAYLDTGYDLLAIKGRLGHGSFGKWLAAEFDMSPRTAERYMAAAKLATEKSDIVSHLSAVTIYALAGPTVSPAARELLLARAASGDKIRAADVAAIVRNIRSSAMIDSRVDTGRRKHHRCPTEDSRAELLAAQKKVEERCLKELQRHEEQAKCYTREAVRILLLMPADDARRLIVTLKKVGLDLIEEALQIAAAEVAV